MRYIAIIILAIGIIGGVVAISAKQDNARAVVYDKCLDSYHANALPLPEYLQDCMQ